MRADASAEDEALDRRGRFALLAAWIAFVLVITLTPGGDTPPLTVAGFLCVACGTRGAADIALNWLVFLPAGVLLTPITDRRRIVVLAAALSATIEIVQIGVAGRDPALQDIVSNTLGALSGVLLVRPGLSARGLGAIAGVAALGWLAPLLFLVPVAPSPELYSMRTPVRGGTRYQGTVLAAAIGGVETQAPFLSDPAAVGAALTARAPVVLLFEAGPPPPGFVNLYQIVDGEGAAPLTIGVIGEDVIVEREHLAWRLGLDEPAARWRGALAGVAPGDTVQMIVEPGRGSMCASVERREACGLAPGLAGGYALLLSLRDAALGWRLLLTLAWPLALGGLIGGAVPSTRSALIGGGALAAVGLLGSALSPEVRPDPTAALLLLGGAALGTALRPAATRVWRALTSAPARPPAGEGGPR